MDLKQYEYSLQTVFIHRGGTGFGHYWSEFYPNQNMSPISHPDQWLLKHYLVYMLDFETGIWREYNDEHVKEVRDLKTIFEKQGKFDGTAYYLAYVRTDKKQDLVSTVVRDVVVPPPEEVDQDEGIYLNDEYEDPGVGMASHVEHVAEPIPRQPRAIAPKPDVGTLEEHATRQSHGWDAAVDLESSDLDANGKPW